MNSKKYGFLFRNTNFVKEKDEKSDNFQVNCFLYEFSIIE